MSEPNLRQKTQRSLIWDLSGSMVRQVAAFAISILLARLLTPAEFGIVGIAMVFVTLTEVFIDVGFTDGIVQRTLVSDSMLSSIFYINFGISVILAILIIAIASIIGRFYNSPEVTQVLYYLGVIPPIAALGKVHSAILVRQMNFKALTLRTILATIIGGLVGIAAALNDQGVFSLVWQQITFAIIATVSLWYASKWKPSWAFSFKEVKEILNFSQHVFFDQLLRQFFNRINTLFVGKVFSPAILGFYSRAESMNSLIGDYASNSLQKVIFPVLSTVQEDEERFARIFFKAIALSAAVAATLAGCLYLMGETIIIGLLGEKWRSTVSIFKILVFSTILAPPIGLISKAVLSKGYANVKFKMGLYQRFLLLLPLPLGIWYSIETFAIGVVAVKFFILLIFIVFAFKKLGLSIVKQLRSIAIPIVPFIIIAVFFEFFLASDIHEAFKTIIFLVVQIFFLMLIHHDVISLSKEMMAKLKTSFLKYI